MLLQREPEISSLIKQWSKQEEQKKAETVSKRDFERFLMDAPNDACYIAVKAISIVAVCGLQRRIETTATRW